MEVERKLQTSGKGLSQEEEPLRQGLQVGAPDVSEEELDGQCGCSAVSKGRRGQEPELITGQMAEGRSDHGEGAGSLLSNMRDRSECLSRGMNGSIN